MKNVVAMFEPCMPSAPAAAAAHPTTPTTESQPHRDEEEDMQSVTYARRRLVTSVGILLGIVVLWLAFGGIAFAEDAAASPPACGGKILENCTPNSGDTAWMLTSVALVLMMTVPGPRPVLWRHGAQEERRRYRDDQLRGHLPRHHPVCGRDLQPGVPRRLAVHRRPRPHVPQGHPERHRQGRYRQSQSAGRDHSGERSTSASR